MNDYIHFKLECSQCKRKIIVEQFLIGVSHATTTVANCLECLSNPLPENYMLDHPEAAADIQKWRGHA